MRNLSILIITFLTIYQISLSSLFAQTLDLPNNLQSPNAAGLGKFGDVPVSYFTGTPNINLPLHSLNIRGIELPVYLSYDASGVRVDEQPSWVGQNWTLHAGGIITRTQRGRHFDEMSTVGTGHGSSCDCGFLYRYNDISENKVDTENELKSLANNSTNLGHDYEADIFTFNFMGKTGKFFLDNDGNWKVLSDDNLKVVFENNLIQPLNYESPEGTSVKFPKVIGGFKILDDQGNTYVFGYDMDAIEFSIGFFGQINGWSIWKSNAWYLTEVYDKFGYKVYSLNYERGVFTGKFYRSTGSSVSGYTGGNWLDPQCYYESPTSSEEVDGELIAPSYLRSISTPYNPTTITFKRESSNELHYDVKDLEYSLKKVFNSLCPSGCGAPHPFYYLGTEPETPLNVEGTLRWSRFKLTQIFTPDRHIYLSYNDNSSERRFLQKLDIYGVDSPYNQEAKKQTYIFEYNNHQDLPKYLSKKIDHWGYYRGGTNYIIPSDLSNYYDQRLPNSDFLTIGMLTKITYPTGGYTSYQYERHDYNAIFELGNPNGNIRTESGIAGGVRIKSITDFDGSVSKVRNFKYVSNYESDHNSTISSGVLARKPKYYFQNWPLKAKSGGTFFMSLFSVNSIVPLANVLGPHIGYSEVIEQRNDGSYTVYKFSNFQSNSSLYDDEYQLNTLNVNEGPYDKINDLSLLRGKILSKKIIDVNNNPVKETNYRYRYDINSLKENENFFQISSNVKYQNVCQGFATSVYFGGAYKNYYFDYDLVEEETINYLEGGMVKETTTYEKIDDEILNTNVRFLKEISNSTSNSGNVKTYFSYPSDFNLSTLTNAFRIGDIVQTRRYMDNYLLETTKMEYAWINGQYVPSKFLKSRNGSSVLKPEITFDHYDNIGNLLQFTTMEGIVTSTLWGYNSLMPIAMVSNANYHPEDIEKRISLSFNVNRGQERKHISDNIVLNGDARVDIDITGLYDPVNMSNPVTCQLQFTGQQSGYYRAVDFTDEGTVSIYFTNDTFTLWVEASSNAVVSGNVTYTQMQYAEEENEIYYESFEEHPSGITVNSVQGENAKTGIKIFSGVYNIPHETIKPGFYRISYWESSDKINWEYKYSEGTVNTGSSLSIGALGNYIDEVRVYPRDAFMTSYTHDPFIGITSKNDNDNLIEYYEYDKSGRLLNIRDKEQTIIKKYEYNYKIVE